MYEIYKSAYTYLKRLLNIKFVETEECVFLFLDLSRYF
jgi:hypothetical protein